VRPVFQIQPRRPPLDAAQQQMLDCAEADRAQFQSVFEGLFDFVEREGLK
jgi:hypothetical protein